MNAANDFHNTSSGDGFGFLVSTEEDRYQVTPSEGRKLVFVGDLVDRGPGTPQVLRLVSGMVEAGHAFCVPGSLRPTIRLRARVH